MNDQFELKKPIPSLENFAIALLLRAFPASALNILILNLIRPVLIRRSLTLIHTVLIAIIQSQSGGGNSILENNR